MRIRPLLGKIQVFLKKRPGMIFRVILICFPILLGFLTVYFPWQEFNYSDRFIQEPLKEQFFMNASAQLDLVPELIEEITKIPEALNYRQICFYNNGSSNYLYYGGEYLVITPILVDLISVNKEILIPYRKEYCITFKGNSYAYKWRFRYDLDLCNESCKRNYFMASLKEKGLPVNYTPPDPHHVALVFTDFPNVEHFDESIPSSYYTNTVIKSEPISMVVKLLFLGIVYSSVILFIYKIKKFIVEGK